MPLDWRKIIKIAFVISTMLTTITISRATGIIQLNISLSGNPTFNEVVEDETINKSTLRKRATAIPIPKNFMPICAQRVISFQVPFRSKMMFSTIVKKPARLIHGR